jgi:hypothetical protein
MQCVKHVRTGRLRAVLLWVSTSAVLAGCTTSPPAPPDGWQAVALPGKSETRYSWTDKAGRRAVRAVAERSASLWRLKVDVPADRLGEASFSWWVDELIAGASVADPEREDAPARVLFGFAGDVSRLPARTRVMFELAQSLSGEPPPYATLMYVLDGSAPVDSVVINPRFDRVRKIVLDSGPSSLGRWRDHRRDLAADYRRAFGEEPGALVSIAVMTDADNTRSRAAAWYGPVQLHGR